MADAIEEAADITGISSSLVINIGTLNSRTVEAMISAGKAAIKRKIPVVLDPVGAGASSFRNDTVSKLLNDVKFSVIRGNISEIRFIAGLSANTKGVDASEADDSSDAMGIAKKLSEKMGCVIAITGAVDVVSDGKNTAEIKNGHPAMSQITGTGCMCTSLIGTFCGAAPETLYSATIAAIATMGISGEIAYSKSCGNGSFRSAIIDAVSRIDGNILKDEGKINEIK